MEIQVKIQHNIGNVLTVSNDVASFAQTYFTKNYAPGVTSVEVSNATDFPVNSLVLLSTIGSENAEFLQVTGATNATTRAITATSFSHQRGESFSIADYNTIEVYKSATLNGSYTLFGTFNIQATLQTTIITDPTGLSSAYYKLKFKNSISGNSSSFSPATSASLFTNDSVASMFDSIRSSFGISEADPIITTEFLLNSLNEARKFVDDTMANFKQSWREKFEVPLQIMAGWNRLYLPEDYDYKWTNNKLLAVRYPRINGLAPYPLTYIDKREWNATAYSLKYSYTTGVTVAARITYASETGLFQHDDVIAGSISGATGKVTSDDGAGTMVIVLDAGSVPFVTSDIITGSKSGSITTVVTYTAAPTTIQIENIGDFTGFVNPTPTGTIFIATNNLSQKIMQVNYTSVDLVTNTFKGCTGITHDIEEGTQMFAFPTFTSATYYTVYQDFRTGKGMIVFNRPVPDIMQGRNVYIDYYKVMTPVVDINTVLEEPYKNIYPYYIRYAIKYRRDNSTSINKNNPGMDPDYARFAELIQEWIMNHYIGQLQKTIQR